MGAPGVTQSDKFMKFLFGLSRDTKPQRICGCSPGQLSDLNSCISFSAVLLLSQVSNTALR